MVKIHKPKKAPLVKFETSSGPGSFKGTTAVLFADMLDGHSVFVPFYPGQEDPETRIELDLMKVLESGVPLKSELLQVPSKTGTGQLLTRYYLPDSCGDELTILESRGV